MSILNNIDIDEMASLIKLPLIGVFSKDELPKKRIDGYYVINMQNGTNSKGKELPGTHWVSCGVIKNKSFYFDSFGCVPPTSVYNYLPKPIMYNTQQIQDIDSSDCGWFSFCCCYYLFKNGFNKSSFNKFVKMFDKNNFKNNDKIINQYANSIFNF